MLSHLKKHLPPQPFGNYFEPFVGGGAFFFSEAFPKAQISDRNWALIQAYRRVRDKPDKVYQKIVEHRELLAKGGRDYYDQVRADFNAELHRRTITQAGRFIFLNHANYNGMYRVNLKGDYNVPYGHNAKPYMPSLKELEAVSESLKNVAIVHCGYDSIHERVREGDFVYLDPPYPQLDPKNSFVGYTIEGFSEIEQVRLATFAHLLHKRGAFVMISFADVPQIKKWYPGWRKYSTPLKRNISAKRPAITAEEVILTNYNEHGLLKLE